MWSDRPSRLFASTSGLAALALCAGVPLQADALRVGQTVRPVRVRDANNKFAWLPDLGKKVLAVFYTDPDAKDQNEAFREQLKASKVDRSRFRGVGIVNLKDTWKPNFIVRSVVRKKIKKYEATILTDPDQIVKRIWSLGDCNDKDIVIVIGKDRRLKYIKDDGAMTAAERARTVDLVKQLIAEGNAATKQ